MFIFVANLKSFINMKIRPIVSLCLLSLMYACSNSEIISDQTVVSSRTSNLEIVATSFDFDIDQYFDTITDPEKWIQYDSFEEKLSALNLPEDILPQLSVAQLAEACAKYPMRLIFTAYSTPEIGANIIIYNFNAFKEL